MAQEKHINSLYGKRIKQIRENNGLTQQQFAGLLGVSISTLSKWENLKINVTLDKWKVPIAELFGMDIETGITWSHYRGVNNGTGKSVRK